MLRTTRFTKQFFFPLRSLSSPALTSEEVLHINACVMLIFVVPVDHVLCLCWHFIFYYSDTMKVVIAGMLFLYERTLVDIFRI